MGYFADIIKDSRLNLAGRRSPVPPLPELDGQPLPAVTAGVGPTPGSPTRRWVGKKPPAVVDGRLTPTAAAPVEPNTVSAEIENAPQPKVKRLPRGKKSQDTRPHPGSGDEHAGRGGSIEATDAHVAMPVIQRKAVATAATGPTLSGVRQPDLPSRGRPAVRHPASNRGAASFRPPGAAARAPPRSRDRPKLPTDRTRVRSDRTRGHTGCRTLSRSRRPTGSSGRRSCSHRGRLKGHHTKTGLAGLIDGVHPSGWKRQNRSRRPARCAAGTDRAGQCNRRGITGTAQIVAG